MQLFDANGMLRSVVGFDENQLLSDQCEHIITAFEMDGEDRYDFFLNFYMTENTSEHDREIEMDVQWNMDEEAYDVYLNAYTGIAILDFAALLAGHLQERLVNDSIPCETIAEPVNLDFNPLQVQISCIRR